MQTLSNEFHPMLLEQDGAGGDGQAADGASQDKNEGNGKDANPLLPDLQVWKERARTAEEKLAKQEAAEADARKESELKAAKTKEELEAVIERHKAESAARERGLELRLAATEAGIPAEFATAADDGQAEIADVVKAATERWTAALDEHNKKSKTNQISPGSSPESGQGKTFTRSQIADPKFYRENRDEILSAQREGRIREG